MKLPYKGIREEVVCQIKSYEKLGIFHPEGDQPLAGNFLSTVNELPNIYNSRGGGNPGTSRLVSLVESRLVTLWVKTCLYGNNNTLLKNRRDARFCVSTGNNKIVFVTTVFIISDNTQN